MVVDGGRFGSVLDVSGEADFVDAVEAVGRPPGTPGRSRRRQMAVLRAADAARRLGGVLFGVDPLTGRPTGSSSPLSRAARTSAWSADRRRTARAHPGARGRGRHGRARPPSAACAPPDPPGPDVSQLFGGPQDVEWAVDTDGRLRLLQAGPSPRCRRRPAGARARPRRRDVPRPPGPARDRPVAGAVAGGPHPRPPAPGASSERAVRGPPVVVSVGGWPAADLDLLASSRPGAGCSAASIRARRPGGCGRPGGSDACGPPCPRWRGLVGRPTASSSTCPPSVSSPPTSWSGAPPEPALLVSLHGHEVLAGLLLRRPRVRPRHRRHAVLPRSPAAWRRAPRPTSRSPRAGAALALVPPRIGPGVGPRRARAPGGGRAPAPTADAADVAIARLALRLPIRWVQELCRAPPSRSALASSRRACS